MSIKNFFFMLNKFWTDVHKPAIPYRIADDMHGQTLGNYYFDFDEIEIEAGKHQALIASFDEHGIPLNKSYIDVNDRKFIYYPITIGQYGLSVFHTYLKTRADVDRQRFLKFVYWFFENAVISENLGVRWLTDVPLPQYRQALGWQSAFSQSRGISILLRGYQISRESKYAEMAAQALIPFTKPTAEGGVTVYTKWGPFYEEYVAAVPTLVLNGMMFAVCGLYDFVRVFPGNRLARRLFVEGIATLEKILPEYNLGFWSRYNLCQAAWYPAIDPATIGYQRLHVNQLDMLYRLTDKEIFQKYATIFKTQDTLLNATRMYLLKYKSLRKIGRL